MRTALIQTSMVHNSWKAQKPSIFCWCIHSHSHKRKHIKLYVEFSHISCQPNSICSAMAAPEQNTVADLLIAISFDAIRQTTNVALQIMSLRKLNVQKASTDGNNGRFIFCCCCCVHAGNIETEHSPMPNDCGPVVASRISYYHLMVFGWIWMAWWVVATRFRKSGRRHAGHEDKKITNEKYPIHTKW